MYIQLCNMYYRTVLEVGGCIFLAGANLVVLQIQRTALRIQFLPEIYLLPRCSDFRCTIHCTVLEELYRFQVLPSSYHFQNLNCYLVENYTHKSVLNVLIRELNYLLNIIFHTFTFNIVT